MGGSACRAGADEVLRYYGHHFPHEPVCKLLGRAWRGHDSLALREVAVETADGVYVRWLSVGSPAELKNVLGKRRACKVHLGAIFDKQPARRWEEGTVMHAEQREFVVDIDIDDYTNSGTDKDDLQACDGQAGGGAGWPLVALGIVIVKTILREKFAFRNMLTVYSGRRGAHLTVYDARACALSDEARTAIADYLQPSKKHTQGGRPVYGNIMSEGFFGTLWNTHIEPFWLSYGLLGGAEGGAGFLDSLIDREDFMRLFGNRCAQETIHVGALSGKGMWRALWECAHRREHAHYAVRDLKETVLSYVWPRLDAEVSKKRNHLSKAFFSLHPKTGRICVPVPGDPLKFQPASCPRLSEIVNGAPEHVAAFKAAVSVLVRFVRGLETSRSEQWTPSRIQPPTRVVYSLVGHKRTAEKEVGSEYVLFDRNRICFNLMRVFTAIAFTAEPNCVKLVWHTVPMAKDSVMVIEAGYSPPWGRRRGAAFPAEDFRKAARDATKRPETEVECARAYVCVLLHPRCCDKEWAEKKLARLRGGLLEERDVGFVNTAWPDSRINAEGLLNSAKLAWEVDHVFLG